MTHNLTIEDIENLVKFVCIGAPLSQAVEVAIALGAIDSPEGFTALAQRIENEAPGLTPEDTLNTALYGVTSPCIEWRWVRSLLRGDWPKNDSGDPVAYDDLTPWKERGDYEALRPFREGVWRLSHFLTFLRNVRIGPQQFTFTGLLKLPEGVQ